MRTEPIPFDRENDELIAQLPERFAVTDAASANWVVRRIVQARAYAQRVKDWADLETRRARREEAFFLQRFGGDLETWLARELAERQSRQKSVNLPAGRVGRRSVAEKLVVEDEQAVLAWARVHLPEAIKSIEAVSKSILNDRFRDTGELPPGVTLHPAHESLVIR